MPSTPSSGSTRTSKPRIPYTDLPAQYQASKREILEAFDEVGQRGDYILGQDVAQFEKRFADYCEVRHAVGVANGTDALLLALKALGIGPGDEVITVPNSFIASASAIALAGARPVFIDVRDDLLMDAGQIERAISPRTRAILPVHLTGRCAEMETIGSIAKRRGLFVLEDAAQSVGSRYHKRRSGSLGTLAAFSLHPLKNLNAMGDAGILTTNDDQLHEKLRLLRNHGLKNRDEAAFWGYNSRLDTLQAALLNHRFKSLDQVIARRRQIAERYRKALSSWVRCPEENPQKGEFHTYHLFVIQAERRDELQAHLAQEGIETKIHYPIPIHLQACSSSLGYKKGDFPVCERLAERVLSLPVHATLTEEQVKTVCHAIKDFYEGKG